MESFVASQSPFYYAVLEWPQSLAGIMANVNKIPHRLHILENLCDEHGTAGSPSHPDSFLKLLSCLGTSPPDEQPVHIRAFNSSMKAFCRFQPVHTSAAMLGAIEYFYVGISECLALHLDKWGQSGRQNHYAVHEEVDEHHAADLFAISEGHTLTTQQKEEAVMALHLGAYYLWNLYADMAKQA